MKLKTIKRIIAISIIVVSFLFFYTLSVPVYGWYDLNLWESTGEMCRNFFTTFLATTDSAISGKSTQQIEYSIYEITDEDKVIASDLENLSISGMIRESKGMFLWPVPGYTKISSPFGKRWGKNHTGIDIPAPEGVIAVAAADGVVCYVNEPKGEALKSGYGNQVVIEHKDGYKTRYGHASKVLVKDGQEVKIGDPVIKIGNTGRSYGNHLHFEILKNGTAEDPMQYFSDKLIDYKKKVNDYPKTPEELEKTYIPQEKEIIQYYQDDYSIGKKEDIDGSAQTCFAMIATEYTGHKVEPKDVLEQGFTSSEQFLILPKKNDNNVDFQYFYTALNLKYNVQCTLKKPGQNFIYEINAGKLHNREILEDIKKALQKLNWVVLIKEETNSSQLITNPMKPKSYHHILLYKIDDKGMFYIKDPKKENAVNNGYNTKAFTEKEITEMMDYGFIFERY